MISFAILGFCGFARGAVTIKPSVGSAKVNTLRDDRLADGLMGYWTLDGKDITATQVIDRSGNNNHGTKQSCSKSIIGKIGQGLKLFDSCTISTTNSSTLTSADRLTVSAWIRLDQYYTDYAYHIINRWTGTDDANYAWYIFGNYLENGGQGNITLYANRGGVWSSISGTYRLTEGVWTHVAVSYDSTLGGQLYVNGSAYGSRVGSGILATNNATTKFYGKNVALDEVRIYNRALSASEVKSLYNAGTAKFNAPQTGRLTSGLVGYWTFDGKDITDKVYDQSGQSNNGYLYNIATSSAKVIGKVGQGLSIGIDKWIDITSSINTGNANWMVSAWVKTTSTGTLYILTNKSGGPVTNAMRISAGKINYYHYNGGWSSESGTIPVNDGKWHLLTWVNSSNQTMDMYVDGVIDVENVSSTAWNTSKYLFKLSASSLFSRPSSLSCASAAVSF